MRLLCFFGWHKRKKVRGFASKTIKKKCIRCGKY